MSRNSTIVLTGIKLWPMISLIAWHPQNNRIDALFAGTEVDDAHFCKDSQIDLSRLDSNKVIRGSIYSPNFPQLYYGDSNCTIRISGLHSDHLITISHRKEDLLGPCIEDFKISNNQTTNECSDLQIIYRHANSLNGLDINLDVSEMAQPGFTLSFASKSHLILHIIL